MIQTRRASVCLVLVLVGCQAQSKPSEGSATAQRPASQGCVAVGGSVDSAFAMAQARRALGQSGPPLAAHLIQPIRDQGIELGLLISLIASEPSKVVGGGGLVWVDLESGCATVLRRYE